MLLEGEKLELSAKKNEKKKKVTKCVNRHSYIANIFAKEITK